MRDSYYKWCDKHKRYEVFITMDDAPKLVGYAKTGKVAEQIRKNSVQKYFKDKG
jgi:hypothetical protein